MYKNGLTVRDFIRELKMLPKEIQTKPIYVCSDEEGNTTFKGFYIKIFQDAVDIRGLSGCELEE